MMNTNIRFVDLIKIYELGHWGIIAYTLYGGGIVSILICIFSKSENRFSYRLPYSLLRLMLVIIALEFTIGIIDSYACLCNHPEVYTLAWMQQFCRFLLAFLVIIVLFIFILLKYGRLPDYKFISFVGVASIFIDVCMVSSVNLFLILNILYMKSIASKMF